MDVVDKKIICELDLNCRKPISKIAKDLRVSRNVVDYRIKNLEKSVIKKYICSLNLAALGYNTYRIFFRIFPSANEDKFIEYLKDCRYVIHLLRTEGIFEYSATVISRSIAELDAFLTEIKNRFRGLIKEYDLSMVVYTRVFKLDKLLLENKESLKSERHSGDIKEIQMDEKDLKILKAISQTANLSLLSLAKNTSLSVDIVKYRLKYLEKNAINACRIVYDIHALGYFHYNVLLRTRLLGKKDEEKLFAWCTLKKNVLYYTKRIGTYDLEISIAVKDIADLNNLTGELKREFSDVIDHYQVVLNTDLLKLDYYPFE